MQEINKERKRVELYTIGKLIQDSFSVIRRDFRVLLEIALLFTVSNLAIYFFLGGRGRIIFSAFDQGNLGYSLGYVLLFSLPIFFLPILGIAQVIAINELSENRSVTVGESIKAGLEKFFPLWLYMGLLGILWIWFYFSYYAVIIEGEEGFFALRRGKQLVQGNGWYVFTVTFITLIVFIAVVGSATGIFWVISHLIAKDPLTADSFFFFYLVTFPIVGIPALASQVLLFKNLREVKDKKVPFFEHIHLSEQK